MHRNPMVRNQPPARSAESGTPQDAVPASNILLSSTLLQGNNSIIIDHQGALYTLRVTRSGKLILTK
ncbi:MAG: hemin uptake protein HemP [Pseudomonadaceae bacterium]|nr:MAG: hemin uptake protein HemP [Pseudomonadaceae bacterium]